MSEAASEQPATGPAEPTQPSQEVRDLVADEDVAPAPTPAGSSATGAGTAETEDASKPVDEWVTGDEPMTGPQHSYLQTLAREAGRELPGSLTKAQASELIDELQQVTGRGR